MKRLLLMGATSRNLEGGQSKSQGSCINHYSPRSSFRVRSALRMKGEGDLEADLKELRDTFNSGKTRSAKWRRAQLQALLNLLRAKEAEIFQALYQDLGKHHVEAFKDEVGILIKSVNFALQNLSQWIKAKKIHLPMVAFPSSAEMVPEPLGLVLICSSWNFPFGLSLEPLIGAIAAGNVVVLKPSEVAPASSAFLANILPLFLDSKGVKVVEGGSSIAERLLEMKWDKIFFTGSQRVGRLVMTAAAKHLTPVTLELGGKCPCVIDSLASSRDRKVAVKRILGGKYGVCSGQACLAIDYLLVEEKFATELVDLIKTGIKRMFVDTPKEIKSMSRIANKNHFFRLKGLLGDPRVKDSIIHGGSVDEDCLFIEPTVLLNPPLEAAIMTEEIFGPLLPIITLKNIEDSIEFIRSRPKPLALYVFTNNEELKRRMVAETSSGCITFNDALIQYVCDNIPFGGVGESGFGTYHGKFSFDTFTHEKPVLRRSFLIEFWFRYPPWNAEKLLQLRAALSFDYLGYILILLGLKKSY